MSDQPSKEAATNTKHKKQTEENLPSAGFEPAIPPIEGLQTYSFGRTPPGLTQYIWFSTKNIHLLD
jgi:hypothetical protein